MGSMDDEKLEAMLRSRRAEAASPDLAERIILKAQSLPQTQAISLTQWVERLFAEFHVPKPAYVLACTLILGFVLGFNAPLNTSRTDDAEVDPVQSFLYADEDVL